MAERSERSRSKAPQSPDVPTEPLRDRDPRKVGGFRLLGRLGYGGMGVAYLAERSGNRAVVKIVRSDLADSSTFRARLLRELEAMRRAAGPHTAALLDSDLDADPPWFAMEFIPGANLGRYVPDGGPLAGGSLEAFALALAQALAHVHAVGVIHRDLKPSNVMMSPTGPRLIDFGIAGMEEGTHLTHTGSIVGSTGWLAPEQVTGDPVTPATDVHAWALCVLYAATGRPPFGADTSTAAMYRVLETTPDIPDWIGQPLGDLITGAVAKDPAYRPTLEQVTSTLITGSTGGWTPQVKAGPSRSGTSAASPDAGLLERVGRAGWVKPAAILGGAGLLVALIVLAALGGGGSEQATTRTSAPTPGPASRSPGVAAGPTSQPGSAAQQGSPTPAYAVKVEYAGSAIPDATFGNSLEWTFDVCSSDKAWLAKGAASKLLMYASQDGTWKRVSAKPTSTKGGGRCKATEAHITIPHAESPPDDPTETWSPCKRYRVVIPETKSFRKSNVDFCVRIRAA